MRRTRYIFCMFLMVQAISLAGQSRSDLRSMFVSAEGDILFEDYAEALPKYLSLLKMFPDNYNLYYRVGQCYLNTPGEKGKSIEWLETAVKNIDTDYRAGRLSEKGAPHDALYHLANAYRIANNFDRALETYDLFLRDADTEKYDTTLVKFQMQSCHNAQEMMMKPADVEERNLGTPVNDRFSEFNPVVSADEKTLLFTRELPFYDAIFWTRKEEGTWTEPVNMTPQLGVDQDYYTSSLSADGRTLLMYRIDGYDGNIYMSRRGGDTWSQVEKLNGNINTKYWESHATLSSDGKKIFFTSNRRESMGGLDIFVSARDSSGNWGPAANLGPQINTIYNEETPFLTNHDSTLFFSSRGHYNMGGYDIFRSDLDKNGHWSTPVNIGYPLNTTDDNLFFVPLSHGDRGYFGKFADDGQGRMDIYNCDIWSDLNPRKIHPEEQDTQSGRHDDTAEGISVADTLTLQIDSLLASVNLPADPGTADPVIISLTEKTDSLVLTEGFVSDTERNAEVGPADVTAPDPEPLYMEIPVMPADENAQDAAAEDHSDMPAGKDSSPGPAPSSTPPADATPDANHFETADKSAEDNSSVDESTPAKTAEQLAATLATGTSQTGVPDNEGDSPQTGSTGSGCCLWWLLTLPALLFFFLIWKRRKKKKENDDE